ncbi:hypothetical protein ANO11243_056090 [Dothideomycetidae sp. 11243]|nr:hypothetical protein ANO11243_056090 [fungal sp. No.11243]
MATAHAVISTFDLFSIGIGPSSSHTVGPMRAGNIFINDLKEANVLPKVAKIHVSLYGSLALTGEGHMTPSALLLGLENENVETVDTSYVSTRFDDIKVTKKLCLGKDREIDFDYERDFRWQWGKKLPLHSNGLRLTVFDADGDMLATNDYFSVGGGFVVNAEPQSDKQSSAETGDSDAQHPRYPFSDAKSLLALCNKHNLTIAQLVYENEKSFGYTDDEIHEKILRIWNVMDDSILEGVQADENTKLPGSLGLHRRAPALYQKLSRGLYPAKALPMDHLSVYAMAVNETNAAGGRVVTAPTNGAAGIIPAVLKYTIEFISDRYQAERDVLTFLLTAAAIGMLYKRGATISAAEGGCMAEVGVACSMAAGAFAACMGARPETIAQAAEIGIEHNLGLTCDPIGGLVQAPCIERNALGAVKAISSANLALSSDPKAQKVSLDDAIRAMRVTALGMRNEFKETSLSGLATSVPIHIPVSVPDC